MFEFNAKHISRNSLSFRVCQEVMYVKLTNPLKKVYINKIQAAWALNFDIKFQHNRALDQKIKFSTIVLPEILLIINTFEQTKTDEFFFLISKWTDSESTNLALITVYTSALDRKIRNFYKKNPVILPEDLMTWWEWALFFCLTALNSTKYSMMLEVNAKQLSGCREPESRFLSMIQFILG